LVAIGLTNLGHVQEQPSGTAPTPESDLVKGKPPLLFMSYAREDLARVEVLVKALERVGPWRCWWDAKLRAGTRFGKEIQRQLHAADCIIVLWSRHSVESDWVTDEASEGVRRGILLPLALDDSLPPLGFRSHHLRRLSAWSSSGPAELAEIVADIGRLTGAVGRRDKSPPFPIERVLLGAGVVVALGLTAAIAVLHQGSNATQERGPDLRTSTLAPTTTGLPSTASPPATSSPPPVPSLPLPVPTTPLRPNPAPTVPRPSASLSQAPAIPQLSAQDQRELDRLDASLASLRREQATCAELQPATSEACFKTLQHEIDNMNRARDALRHLAPQ
jgi:hypothetical protein